MAEISVKYCGSGGGIRTPDTRIMIPQLSPVIQYLIKIKLSNRLRGINRLEGNCQTFSPLPGGQLGYFFLEGLPKQK